MTFSAAFFVAGSPKAQPRARAFACKGKIRVYDPATAEGWKSVIADAAKSWTPRKPLDCAVAVHCTFYLDRPKSRCRKSDPNGSIWCLSKPDCDNLAKALLDCLTQLRWWVDDSRVCVLDVRKKFHGKADQPGMAIQVYELPEVPND